MSTACAMERHSKPLHRRRLEPVIRRVTWSLILSTRIDLETTQIITVTADGTAQVYAIQTRTADGTADFEHLGATGRGELILLQTVRSHST